MRYTFCTLALIALALPAYQGDVHAGASREIFTIYLVRHAEKDSASANPDNPGLASCGQLRSQALAVILSEIDLNEIYSTGYRRTLNTAAPIAASKQLEVTEYDPSKLEEFARLLRSRKQDALVVGHSNTTGVLAGLIAGEKGEEMAEDNYDSMYQVVSSGDQSRVYLLQQAFDCRF